MSARGRSGGDAVPRSKVGGWHPVVWLCELAGTFFQLFVGLTMVVALESALSPLNEALPWQWLRLALIGAELGLLATVVAVSPLGRRSGTHLNPVVTIGFWARGQTHTHDLLGFLTAGLTAGAPQVSSKRTET